MSDAKPQATTNAPFLKTVLVLWVLALCGMLLVLPYVATLESKALAAAAARTHFGVSKLLALSVVQSAVLLAVAVLAGLWAARKLGLGTPLIAAFLTGGPAPPRTRATLLIALAAGIGVALALLLLDRWLFAPIPSVAELIRNAGSGSARPSAWQGLLASFYGALDEEILMRLGLLSLLALALRSVARWRGGRHDVALPAGVFWLANILTAVLFGLGHLPATAALAPLSAALVARAIVLNGAAGLVFGVLYKRYGLEWAMASHFGVDIVAHVALG
ncbi:MAG TPA: CPBP family intramembrane glutamic endopeptidase [Rhizomicrobium sp.]